MMSRQAADENRSDVVAEDRDRIAEGGSCARSLAPGSGCDRHRRRRQGDNCRPWCVCVCRVDVSGRGVAMRLLWML